MKTAYWQMLAGSTKRSLRDSARHQDTANLFGIVGSPSKGDEIGF